MKRISVQTVTLPILVVATSARSADGLAPMFLEESALVRVVTEADAQRWVKTEFKSAEDHAFYVGLSKLKWGWDEKDELTLSEAYEKLAPFVQGNLPSESKVVRLGKNVSLQWGGWGIESAPSMYSQLVTRIFQDTRFVMWFSEKSRKFLPGLYCPDRRTAVFAMRFMGRHRVCPKCDTPFIPATSNMDYCSVKHREAHRVARFRWRAKQPVANSSTP